MKPTEISPTLHYAAHACVHDVQATLFTIHHGSLENKWTHTHTRMLSMSHSGAKYEGTNCTM